MEVIRDARYSGGYNGLVEGDEKDRKTQRCNYREQLPALGSRWLLMSVPGEGFVGEAVGECLIVTSASSGMFSSVFSGVTTIAVACATGLSASSKSRLPTDVFAR
jgi:hypothetical protein